MKCSLQRVTLLALAMMILCVPAFAESVSFNGTVTAAYTHEVYATSSGMIERVPVVVGQTVSISDTIATLRTNKVYADEDGVISAIFGRIGDLTETITERYGAVISMEGPVSYTIAASVTTAYDSVQTKLVHVGETVYLRSRSTTDRTGVGVITSVDGSDYTVFVTSGDFMIGEAVNIYRSEEYRDAERIGRGNIARNVPISVTGSGRIVSLSVMTGDIVKRGDLLMETLDGSGASNVITADVEGVVAELNVTQGNPVEENNVIAVLWPNDAMQIEMAINESDLALISVDDEVDLIFEWNADSAEKLTGTVTFISTVSDDTSENTQYVAYVSFTPNDSVRYGMNVTVNTRD